VNRLAAATNAEVLATLPAHLDPGIDVLTQFDQRGPVRHVGQPVAIDVAEDEIAVDGVFQPEQLRRKGRDVAGPIHAGDRKGIEQLIEKYALDRAQHQTGRVVDLADELEFARQRRGQSPELAQETVIGALDAGLAEGARHVAALALLDIEADPVDALGYVKVEHLTRRGQALGRQHRDHMKWDAALAEPADPSDGLVESAAPGTGAPINVVQLLRTVDANPDIDRLLGEERAPRVINQRSIGLKRVRQRHVGRLHAVDQPKGAPVEIDREHHRLTGMPDNA